MKASGFHLPLCKREMLISTALFDNVKSFWHSNSLVHSYERRRERERVREGREGVREGREGQGGERGGQGGERGGQGGERGSGKGKRVVREVGVVS